VSEGMHGVLSPEGAPLALTLVEEIGHRVVNEFTEAIAALSLAARVSPSPMARDSIEEAARALLLQAELHRALLPPAPGLPTNLPDYLARICNSFSKSVLAARGVKLLLRADEVRLPADEAWRVALILIELVRNAARHAKLEPGDLIVVEVTRGDEQLTCRVRDTGRSSAEAKPGRGHRLIQALAAGLGGHATWRLGPAGSEARIDLPLPDRHEQARSFERTV